MRLPCSENGTTDNQQKAGEVVTISFSQEDKNSNKYPYFIF